MDGRRCDKRNSVLVTFVMFLVFTFNLPASGAETEEEEKTSEHLAEAC